MKQRFLEGIDSGSYCLKIVFMLPWIQQDLLIFLLPSIDSKQEETISINVEGKKYTKVTGRIFTSPKKYRIIYIRKPEKIKPQIFTGASLKGNFIECKIAAIFCSGFRIEIAR